MSSENMKSASCLNKEEGKKIDAEVNFVFYVSRDKRLNRHRRTNNKTFL